MSPRSREVLNGVGVDGVGGIFPFFSFFFVFLRFCVALMEDKGKRLQFTARMGNFTPTPSALTPCKTSRRRGARGREGVYGGLFFCEAPLPCKKKAPFRWKRLVPPDAAPNAPSALWNTEKKKTMIFLLTCHQLQF